MANTSRTGLFGGTHATSIWDKSLVSSALKILQLAAPHNWWRCLL